MKKVKTRTVIILQVKYFDDIARTQGQSGHFTKYFNFTDKLQQFIFVHMPHIPKRKIYQNK